MTDPNFPTNPPRPESPASQPVASVSRVTFNYLLIGAVALLVGILLGYFGYERVASRPAPTTDTAAIDNAIARAVGTAIAALPTAVTPEANPRIDVGLGSNRSIGAEDAVITMIQFADFRCGFCKRFQDETLNALMERYEGQIRMVHRDYPVLGPESLASAVAAHCANDQGKFWEFHDLLYANQAELNPEAFLRHAESLGMDTVEFQACFDEQRHRNEIIEDYVAGQNAGVTGTPTFFINGRILVGAQPIEAFIRLIDAELAAIAAQSETPEGA